MIFSKHKSATALLLGILTLLIAKEGLAWDFDKLKEDASGWIDKKKEETSDYIDRKREETSDYIERKKEDVSDWSREKSEKLKKKGEDWSERTRERIEKGSERVREKTKSFYEDTKEKASEYIRKYEPEIKEKAERAKEEFVGFLKDSGKQKDIIEKIKRFDRAKQEVEIGLIKALPVYDPRDGKVKTFDRFMREMVTELGGDSLGGELAEDPVKTAYLMSVDTDYFLKMNLIPGPEDGQWLSINEALKAGYKTSDVEQLREEYYAMKEAFRDSDAESLNRHLTYFGNELSKIQPQRRRAFIIKENISKIAPRLGLLLVFLILLIIIIFCVKSLFSYWGGLSPSQMKKTERWMVKIVMFLVSISIIGLITMKKIESRRHYIEAFDNANAFARMGNYSEALDSFKECLKYRARDKDVLLAITSLTDSILNAAEDYAIKNARKKAIELCSFLVSNFPDDVKKKKFKETNELIWNSWADNAIANYSAVKDEINDLIYLNEAVSKYSSGDSNISTRLVYLQKFMTAQKYISKKKWSDAFEVFLSLRDKSIGSPFFQVATTQVHSICEWHLHDVKHKLWTEIEDAMPTNKRENKWVREYKIDGEELRLEFNLAQWKKEKNFTVWIQNSWNKYPALQEWWQTIKPLPVIEGKNKINNGIEMSILKLNMEDIIDKPGTFFEWFLQYGRSGHPNVKQTFYYKLPPFYISGTASINFEVTRKVDSSMLFDINQSCYFSIAPSSIYISVKIFKDQGIVDIEKFFSLD